MDKQRLENSTVFQDIRSYIDHSKQEIAISVNATLSLLYWQIGKRIIQEVSQVERAEYVKQIVFSLSQQLSNEYGKDWSEKQLRHCIRFAEVFPEKVIVYILCTQLS